MAFAWTPLAANLALTAIMALAVAIAGWLPALRYQPRLRYALWILVVAKLIAWTVFKLPMLSSAAASEPSPAGRQAAAVVGTIVERRALRFEPVPDGSREPGVSPLRGGVESHSKAAPGENNSPLESSPFVPGWRTLAALALVPAAVLILGGLWQMRRAAGLIRRAATADGQAFMSSETGESADPYPDVMIVYPTDEEDCAATRYAVLKPGESITFTTPSCLAEQEEVSLVAFFVRVWPPSKAHEVQRGSYTLTFTRAPADVQAQLNVSGFHLLSRGVTFIKVPGVRTEKN